MVDSTQSESVGQPRASDVQPLATAALLLWPLVAIVAFSALPPRRALMIVVIGGFLLLPQHAIVLPAVPPYTKTAAISLSALLGVVLFDSKSLTTIKWSWIDALPLAALIAAPAASLTNGLGVNDAILETSNHLLDFTILYFLGRACLRGPEAIRELAMGIAVAAVAFMPLVLWEIRMSPQLHAQIYGRAATSWEFVNRDGWRPTVFFPNPLGLAIWMASSVVVIWWLWLIARVRTILGIPMQIVAWGGLCVTVFTRCMGATVLLMFGIACILATRMLGWRRSVLAGAVVVVVYISTAMVGEFVPIRDLPLSAVEALGREDKAGSLRMRFVHEELLVRHAMGRPLFGWGGWGGSRAVDSEAILEATKSAGIAVRRSVVTDGLWIIVLGCNGLFGLIGMWGWMVIPGCLAVVMALRMKVPDPLKASVCGLAAFSFLYAIDLLLNAFWSSVQPLVAGALASFVVVAAAHWKRMSALRRSGIESTSNRPRRSLPVAADAKIAV